MAGFLFYDVVFWDNTLPAGEGVGSVVGEEEVVGYEGGEYVYAKRQEVPADQVLGTLAEPTELEVGPLKAVIRLQDGELIGAVQAVTLDLPPGAEATELPPAAGEEAAEGAPKKVQVTGLAPFPVLGELAEDGKLTVVEQEIKLPRSTLRVKAGGLAELTGEAGSGVVDVIEATEGGFIVRHQALRRDAAPLSNPANRGLPFIVLWLVTGAVYFTVRMSFINLRGFGHAIAVTRGDYDNPDDPGEVSHFQALSAALSATVGLGNIAGVAIAVAVGGPGAIFWMVMAGFLGMSSKFTECTLGQMYRVMDEHGRVSGGPMRYLRAGLDDLGLGPLGRFFAGLFALMCIGGSLGGGNMFQANQSHAALAALVPFFAENPAAYGVLLAVAVGLVIIGGIKSIGKAAGVIVPAMCGIYVAAALFILLSHASEIPSAFGTIVSQAFTPDAGYGGIIGVLVQGFRRAAFSNEAGVGSASIAHSAASTDEPVREGIVALLEPFIDTIVVCTMTGLVVVITGAYQQDTGDGVLMTNAAFESVIWWFPYVLSAAVVLFAFSTMISWSYYGERCWHYLFDDLVPHEYHDALSLSYKVVFLIFVVFGVVFKLGNVLDFSDLMILGMAFPNIFGAVLLSGKVKAALDDYWGRYQRGEMKSYRDA
ncbi:MAG: alanine:cation symporter family protein [Alphaproteobacteria bacterium]|nr:alanine:cation symporter family protein [Alphaproteobacteria bacterium]